MKMYNEMTTFASCKADSLDIKTEVIFMQAIRESNDLYPSRSDRKIRVFACYIHTLISDENQNWEKCERHYETQVEIKINDAPKELVRRFPEQSSFLSISDENALRSIHQHLSTLSYVRCCGGPPDGGQYFGVREVKTENK